MIPKAHAKEINKKSRILNIHWIEQALDNEVDITCTRSQNCPREKKCDGRQKSKVSWITEVKKEINKTFGSNIEEVKEYTKY